MKDYSKIKALAQSILECIGDESEGGDGTEVKHSEKDRGGPATDEVGSMHKGDHMKVSSESMVKPSGKPKRDDDVIALYASQLSSKFNK